MPFRVKPADKVPLSKRRGIRRAIQERIVAETVARHGATAGQCVSTPGGFLVELLDKRRVPLSPEDQSILAQAYAWEKTGEGNAPNIRQ